ESIGLLKSINLKKSDNLTAGVDKKDKLSIKNGFDAAEKTWEDYRILLASLTKDKVLSDSVLNLIHQNLDAVKPLLSGIKKKRFYAFHEFAWVHIEKAKQLFKEGKGTWNDDEDKFMDAVVELNFARSVSDEISKSDRNEADKLHVILKSELSSAEFQKAMDRSEVLLGTKKWCRIVSIKFPVDSPTRKGTNITTPVLFIKLYCDGKLLLNADGGEYSQNLPDGWEGTFAKTKNNHWIIASEGDHKYDIKVWHDGYGNTLVLERTGLKVGDFDKPILEILTSFDDKSNVYTIVFEKTNKLPE
ncbi:MAG: hypothetical protein H8E46_03705, partial [FCB group bacterium]|nr:hypothetical protein [FCB group bacterium]